MQKTHTHIGRIGVAGILMFSLVGQAIAAGTLAATDSIAGLGSRLSLTGWQNDASIEVRVQPPYGPAWTTYAQADGNGQAAIELSGERMTKSGVYDITAVSSDMQAYGSMEVLPETLDVSSSRIVADQSVVSVGVPTIVSVRLVDRYGNPLPLRPVQLLSSRTTDSVEPLDTHTDALGEQQFEVVAGQNGAFSLRAVDVLSGKSLAQHLTLSTVGAQGGYADTNSYTYAASATTYAQNSGPSRLPQNYGASPYSYLQAQATFDVIEGFRITAPASIPANEEIQNLRVEAVDRNGNIVQDYQGTIILSAPLDPGAQLPSFGSYAFRPGDLGRKDFPFVLKFSLPGQQVLRIEDQQDPSIFGEVAINVTGTLHQASGDITISNFTDGDAISTTTITLVGEGPALSNLMVMGGRQDAFGSTNEVGQFSIPVELTAGQENVTLRVREENGRADSGPLNLVLDQEEPTIEIATFSPERPIEEQRTLVAVEAESGLASLVMTLDGEDYELSENGTTGSYQTFFEAPIAGTYQPVITATDRAGNENDIRVVLQVEGEGLPQVQNVTGEGKIGSIALEWDELDQDVDGYRVYVGENPSDFLYSLDTGRPTNRATVAGLDAGKTYYLAVTALRDDVESEEKSEVIEVQVVGITLNITPQDSSMLIAWPDFSSDVPLAAFVLEFGTEPGTYTERRTINGDLRAYALRDLINGVTYYVRLTPVAVTGDDLADLAATGEGTPNGEGFSVSPSDPLPFDASSLPQNPSPGQLDNTGASSWLWMSAFMAAIAVVGAYLHRQRSRKRMQAFLRQVHGM